MPNAVTLTFVGNAQPLQRTTQQVTQSVSQMGNSVAQTSHRMQKSFAATLSGTILLVNGIQGLGDAIASLRNITSISAEQNDKYQRSLNDVAQAQQDQAQAAADGRQATLDYNQSLIDGAQAGLDYKQSLIDGAQAGLDYQQSLRDSAQAALDLKQALNDTVQAGLDATQAQLNYEKAVQDYKTAVKQNGATSLEAKQAMLDQEQAQQDLVQAQQDGQQSLEDQKQAQQDAAQAIQDGIQAQQDQQQAVQDGIQAQQDANQAAEDGRQALNDQSQAAIDSKNAQLDLNEAQRNATKPWAIQGWIDALSDMSPLIFTVIGLVEILTTVQWSLNAAMYANPIGLVVLAILALIAIIIVVIKYHKQIGEFFTKVWGGIKDFFINTVWHDGLEKAFNWIKEKAEDVFNFFKELPGKIGGWLSGIYDTVVNAFKGAFNWVTDQFNKIIRGINAGIHGFNAINPFKDVPDIPELPHLHSGGIVPGMPGQDVLTVLQGGERVTPRGGDGGGGTNLTIYIDGVKAVQKYVKNNGGNVQLALGR